jgi:N-acetylmuramoyl-L-alanine amidase
VPAALAELEFISSNRLDEWLATPEAAERFALALFDGLAAYARAR